MIQETQIMHLTKTQIKPEVHKDFGTTCIPLIHKGAKLYNIFKLKINKTHELVDPSDKWFSH